MKVSNTLISVFTTYVVAASVIAAMPGNAKAALVLYRTEAEAQRHCPKDGVVWLDFIKGNTTSRVSRYMGEGEPPRSSAARRQRAAAIAGHFLAFVSEDQSDHRFTLF